MPTEYGHIQKEVDGESEWFDFKTDKGTPCMDGETCEIIEKTDNYVLLQKVKNGENYESSRDMGSMWLCKYRSRNNGRSAVR